MSAKIYAFDLDGTVTKEEILPLLARELGLEKEMKLLTKLTLEGQIDFEQSFRLRYHILKGIPLEKIHQIIRQVKLDEAIENFIKTHGNDCAIVTGNLNLWIEPIVQNLQCRCFSSVGELRGGEIHLLTVLQKSDAIRQLKSSKRKVIAIGESFNDVCMFEEADISVSFGGVHRPVSTAISISDYVVFRGRSLCRLLEML